MQKHSEKIFFQFVFYPLLTAVLKKSEYNFVPKGVHENRTKGVENKVDDTLKLVVFLECAQC